MGVEVMERVGSLPPMRHRPHLEPPSHRCQRFALIPLTLLQGGRHKSWKRRWFTIRGMQVRVWVFIYVHLYLCSCACLCGCVWAHMDSLAGLRRVCLSMFVFVVMCAWTRM